MSDSNQQTAPGWYADPRNPSAQRWWDGTQWTAQQQQQVAAVQRYVPRTVVQSDQKLRFVQAPVAWIIAICTLGYMLPWAIAASRGKSNALAIGLVNALAGWTVIGWIIALVMACSSHQKFTVTR